MKNPFSDSELRDLFFLRFQTPVIPLDGAVTMGSGPFGEDEFDNFLRQHGINPYLPSPSIDIVVVGWVIMDEDKLLDMISLRRGKTLKVYSQEMFVWYLLTGTDPFDQRFLPRDALLKFADNHDVLESLMSTGGFEWPTTYVANAFGVAPLRVAMPAKGMLKHYGYSVGRNGLLEGRRREILAELFYAWIPQSCPVENKEEWGNASSSQRLRKMADTIAALCRNLKRRTHQDVDSTV